MLDIESFVPEVYVKNSRDFQMYCKLLEIISNDVKFNADTITDIYNPFICNNRMLELLCTLYNYQPRRDISDHDLRIILANYSYMIKHKGTKKGIEAAISLAVKLTGKNLKWHYRVVTKDNENQPIYTVYVNISSSYDKAYLHEFLDLVLPVGYIVDDSIAYEEEKATEGSVEIQIDTDTDFAEDVSSVLSIEEIEDTKKSVERTEVLE